MDNTSTYGKFDKFIHWLMALNIFATLILSYGMSDLPEPLKPEEYGGHGASVTTIAICLIIRAIWRARQGFPPLPTTMSDMQQLAAKAVHYLLYICLFAQVSVGIMLASTTKQDFIARGYNINYSSFDLVNDAMYDTLLTFHKGIYWTIVALLVVHIVAALKHHFVDKDDVLVRMLPFTKRS
ncbi:cytochrome b [Spongiibacter sp. KMU-166]|uniref:Cytochrome b n=1 Tax=Spongiibacter thalassae TaxID=2721624 RepID=A0ABX1G9T7_9GAMM|nr:cytochrome b [Spongiibacter thalassae]NKI15919.1 cytochrome b [Spongiibacter thalassae]